MQIIDELEPVKRGGYGGAIGYLSYAGDLDTAIHIRTVVVKDGVAHVQAGGGTVADAKPAYEYEESVAKSRAVAVRSTLADGSRSCACEPAASWRRDHECSGAIDNYDSFTYNLVQYLGELGAEVRDGAQRSRDASMSCSPAATSAASSRPGPCTPDEAGITLELVRRMPEAGCRRSASASATRRSPRPSAAGRLHEPVHGKATTIEHDGRTIFAGLSSPLTVGRYHSLVVDPQLPDCLEESARGGGVRDGRAPSRAARRGRAVSPRVGADRARARRCWRTSSGER